METKTKKTEKKETEVISVRKELILTLSNQKSLFSSKKLERAVVFYTFIIISVVYIILNIKVLEPFDLLQIVGLWLAYGGYNTYQNYKDKKLFKEETTTTEVTDPTDEEYYDDSEMIKS